MPRYLRRAAAPAGKEVRVFDTRKQRVIAVGTGALAGLTLMGGVAFAQTPGGASPTPEVATATATAEADTEKDGKDCPREDGSTGAFAAEQGGSPGV
jgi:hypothetical protein